MKVLVIVNEWPSKEHPYLIYLYNEMRKGFSGMYLFLFNRVMNPRFADELIGQEATAAVLSKALYRFVFTYNPFMYVFPVVKFIFYPLESIRIFKAIQAEGFSIKKSASQLLYGYQLIGRDYDLIYINSLQIGRHIAVTSFFPRSKILASSRGQDFDWYPERYDQLLVKLDYLHVLGNHLRKRAIDRKFPEERIIIIPPAILPVKQFTYDGSSADGERIQIVTAARLIWGKGCTYNLRAVALLKEKIKGVKLIRYIILGQGEDLELLRFEIRRLGLEDIVVLKGWVGQDEVNEILFDSHIYLLLSIDEGFNNSVMQAQSLGLPCVVSDAGGLPDNVLNGQTGYVVPRYATINAAEKLQKLIMDESLRKRMGDRAKERMLSEFSLDHQVDKYKRMFNSILRRF